MNCDAHDKDTMHAIVAAVINEDMDNLRYSGLISEQRGGWFFVADDAATQFAVVGKKYRWPATAHWTYMGEMDDYVVYRYNINAPINFV